MAQGCYNCNNLDPKQKKPGAVNGCLYYCKKHKKMVNPTMEACDKYTKSSRKLYEDDDLYKDGEKFYDDKTPTWVYLYALIFLIILGLILGVFW